MEPETAVPANDFRPNTHLVTSPWRTDLYTEYPCSHVTTEDDGQWMATRTVGFKPSTLSRRGKT